MEGIEPAAFSYVPGQGVPQVGSHADVYRPIIDAQFIDVIHAHGVPCAGEVGSGQYRPIAATIMSFKLPLDLQDLEQFWKHRLDALGRNLEGEAEEKLSSESGGYAGLEKGSGAQDKPQEPPPKEPKK